MKPAKYLYDSASRIVGFRKFFITTLDNQIGTTYNIEEEIDSKSCFSEQEIECLNS